MNTLVLGLLPHRGESLVSLRAEGQLDRLLADYLPAYSRRFREVRYFSYGTEDANISVPGRTRVFVRRGSAHGSLYALMMAVRHHTALKGCDVLRVFQAPGAAPALLARLVHRTPFAVTYGYHYAAFDEVRGEGILRWYNRVIVHLALRFADAVIITSRSVVPGLPTPVDSSRLHVIPNGVDTELFRPSTHAPTRRVLAVGRLTAERNVTLLVDAAARIEPAVEVVVVGDGPERDTIRRRADQLRLDLRLLGVVPHHLLPSVMASADVFVLPSRMEGHPKALLEAMSAGLPCVATRVPASVEILDAGRRGMIVGFDSGEMAAAIAALLDDPPRAHQLADAARSAAVEHYELGALISREIDLLIDLASRR